MGELNASDCSRMGRDLKIALLDGGLECEVFCTWDESLRVFRFEVSLRRKNMLPLPVCVPPKMFRDDRYVMQVLASRIAHTLSYSKRDTSDAT